MIKAGWILTMVLAVGVAGLSARYFTLDSSVFFEEQ